MSTKNVFAKLAHVRSLFLQAPVKKSGKNKFAGYEYFELGDFIPTVNRMFDEHGLLGVVRFHANDASLTVYNTEAPDDFVVFTTPLVYASNPKGQAIQDLGSTHTYLRRYLWLMAMEIVEHDSVDASAPVETPKAKTVAAPKPKATMSADDQKLMIEKMIEHAHLCQTNEDLKGLWKANQPQIDEIKSSNPEGFEQLKTAFAQIKSNLGDQ